MIEAVILKSSTFVNKNIREIEFPKNVKVGSILRDNNVIIPNSRTEFKVDDDVVFYAEKNAGSFFNNRRVRVSKKVELEDCLFATNHKGAIHSKLNLRYTGCAALDLAYVASGRFDGYFHNKINIWDIAAGVLIINEAGG